MPRQLKNQDAETEATPADDFAQRYRPWRGNREELDAPTFKDGKVVKVGKPLFYVERNKLIGVYKGGSGISRRLFQMLKPPTPKNEQDVRALTRARELKAFRLKLKKAGIPGA